MRPCARALTSRLGRSADGLVDAKLRMYVTELTVSSVTELVYSLKTINSYVTCCNVINSRALVLICYVLLNNAM